MAGRALVLGLMAAGAVAASATLGLAQDQQPVNAVAAPAPDTTPPAPTPTPDNSVGSPLSPVEENTTSLDLPPPVAAPEASERSNTVAAAPANAVDEAPPPPDKRPSYPVVVLQALDKATAETLRFEARVGEPIRYKDLVIVPHACQTQAADEPYAQTAAHLDVQFQPADQPLNGQAVARQVFEGWMFADSPGLHPFQHPTYDLWVIACKTPSPAPAPPAPASPPVAGAHL